MGFLGMLKTGLKLLFVIFLAWVIYTAIQFFVSMISPLLALLISIPLILLVVGWVSTRFWGWE